MEDPDLTIGPLAISIWSREHPGSDDFSDGNWLSVSASITMDGASVEAFGAFLRSDEISQFHDEIEKLSQTLNGSAHLKCLEPNLDAQLSCDARGHLKVVLSLTPDHMTQSHIFHVELDQTYLTAIVASCKSVLRRFPVIGR